MNAPPKSSQLFDAATATVDQAAIASLPNSRKVYIEGSRPDIRVPMRAISQSATSDSFGGEPNPPLFVRAARLDESVALLSSATHAKVLDPVSQGELLTCLATIQDGTAATGTTGPGTRPHRKA